MLTEESKRETNPQRDLEGKVAIVTGAASGIGLAITNWTAAFRESVLPADAIARAIAFGIEQPAEVDVNEIVVRPIGQSG